MTNPTPTSEQREKAKALWHQAIDCYENTILHRDCPVDGPEHHIAAALAAESALLRERLEAALEVLKAVLYGSSEYETAKAAALAAEQLLRREGKLP